jgi:hypothetical protein
MHRRRAALILGAVTLVVAGCTAVIASPVGATPSYPTTNPAAVCGTAALDGPTTAPAGAVTVPTGDNSGQTWAADTTYYFATGTHILGTDQYSQIQAKAGSTYLGAPGAVLDGQHLNKYAFTQDVAGVSVEHLTITNFIAPQDEGVVNHDSGNGWTVQANTIIGNNGAALMAGADNTISGNCLKDNGQYGLNAYKSGGLGNLTLSGNEITGNNTGDWETVQPGCGCSGGVKFWAVNKADVTGNWIHANHGVGLWADTNNNDFLVSGNLIEDNESEGLLYEISYNAQIKDNVFRGNAIKAGQKRATSGDNFPVGAIYLSETDGESRVAARTSKIDVTGNLFENNWGGVIAWANADRFCNSPANTSSGTCTLVHPTTADCAAPGINTDPLYTDCRWWTKNVEVHANEFTYDPVAIGTGGCNPTYCGRQGLLSNWGTYPSWSPYTADSIQQNITFHANNSWHDNTYTGPWSFVAKSTDTTLTPAQWQASPYGQDAGSTFPSGGGSSTPPPSSDPTSPPTSTTTPVPGPAVLAHNGYDLGKDVAQYGVDVAPVRGGANGGTGSMKFTTTDPWGSGVETDNYPGYEGVTAGASYDASVWYKESAATMPTVTWHVRWRGDDGAVVRQDDVTLVRVTDWTQAGGTLVAPDGATHVDWTYTWAAPTAGPAFQVDEESIALHS